MNFITTTEAAKKWGITKDRVLKLAKDNRIPGVMEIGSRWMIPSDAEKPIDARYKSNKTNHNNIDSTFRYPSFEGVNVKEIYPPLTRIELLFKELSEYIYACKFEKAEVLFNKLLKENLNSYEYYSLLRAGCYIFIYLNKRYEFFDCYEKITNAINEGHFRKEELSLFLMEINLTVGFDVTSIKEFKIKHNYKYHESFLPHLSAISTVSLNFSSTNRLTEHDLMPYEYMCASYEYKNCLVDKQTMHYYIGITYGLMNVKDKMTYHINKSLEIAYKYNLLYTPAVGYSYVKKMIDPILNTYPKRFVDKFKTLSNSLYARYSKFAKAIFLDNINIKLNTNDYIFIYYAVFHYSNKEVASLLNISESNVGKRYSIIYETLGISSKQELIDYYNKKTK